MSTSGKIVDSKEKPKRSKVGCIIGAVLIVFFLIILASIILPSFMNFSARSIQNEAKMLLKAVYRAEEAYHDKSGCYCADIEALGDVGIVSFRYSWEILRADCDGFVVRAMGNIDRDPAVDVWEVSESSPEPVCIFDDVRDRGAAE